ncbi:hypothetical protein BD289DRAFT_133814 [Coniella lustricola]|uniref:Uncharacterized protein n=1 Tax=Coniella lustricola TaxID=2025994 RepID=A0A2T2ZVR6_9PEZI|nr:hypothetical protein BD289DRAFT_133814 [Coniella lustricola]
MGKAQSSEGEKWQGNKSQAFCSPPAWASPDHTLFRFPGWTPASQRDRTWCEIMLAANTDAHTHTHTIDKETLKWLLCRISRGDDRIRFVGNEEFWAHLLAVAWAAFRSSGSLGCSISFLRSCAGFCWSDGLVCKCGWRQTNTQIEQEITTRDKEEAPVSMHSIGKRRRSPRRPSTFACRTTICSDWRTLTDGNHHSKRLRVLSVGLLYTKSVGYQCACTVHTPQRAKPALKHTPTQSPDGDQRQQAARALHDSLGEGH